MSPRFKAAFRTVTRILAVPTAVMTCLIIYDIITPASSFDQARITEKDTFRGRAGMAYSIEAKGNFDYSEKVSKRFFDTAAAGDTINVALSRFFGEWKSLELVRNGRVVVKQTGMDIYYMGVFGLRFPIPLLAFLPEERLFAKLILVFSIPLLEFVAVLLWVKLVLVWAGVFEKM